MKISKKRQEICDEAKTWMGTPWQHQACVKGVGVDCAMFVAGVAKSVGLIEKDDFKIIPNYPKDWHLHHDIPMLLHLMELFGCKEKINKKARPGDIVIFKIGRVPSHLGILLEDNVFIHALHGAAMNEVVMNGLTAAWSDRLVGVYNFPRIK